MGSVRGQKGKKMYLIDTRKYDDSFLLAKILEKVDFTDEETKKLFKHFEKPTVDAVEVVRCKDCIYQAECAFTEWLGRNGNGFCSCGEKINEVEE